MESAIDKIKLLRRNSKEIRDLYDVKYPKWRADSKHYDKIGSGFNTDTRFRACKAIEIGFDSHMGTYGDSGCTSQCDLDDKIFNNHLLKYLNNNQRTIMLEIAKSIDAEATTLKEEAEAELLLQMKMVQELA